MISALAPNIGTTTKVYRIFIKATPQAIRDKITKPEWTEKWSYGLHDEYDLRPGGQYRGQATESMKQFGVSGAMVDGDKQGPGTGAGWLWVLSDLKTTLENGARM